MNEREIANQKRLKEKPLIYGKIMKFQDKVKNKECIGLIQLQYRYTCNFMCRHCAIEKFSLKKSKMLTPQDVQNIADQADAMGLVGISISGGEPLIFKDLEEIVNSIGQERFNICLDTNGWLLDENKLEWLKKIGIGRIHLSIDGTEDNHDKFRKKEGSWGRCMKALEYANKINFPIIINTVVTKSMLYNGKLIEQLEGLKGQYTSLLYAKPTGSFSNYKDEILNTQDIEYVEELASKYNGTTHLTPCYGNDFGCFAFKRHFSITAFGDVLACPWIPIYFGNIYEEPLKVIVERGLQNKWFSYDNKYSCLAGNTDGYFYNNIMPQLDNFEEYPVNYKLINWEGEKE